MRAKIHSHVRHNSVEYLVLFLVLGGTAWALETNSVRSRHIVNGQVKAEDTKASQVQARVDGTCVPGESIRAIDESGAVACEPAPAGGPPTGAAGEDLAGSFPNPQIAPGAVNSAKVNDDSLTGADIAESTLAQVHSALIGGHGRTGAESTCNPDSVTFVPCAATPLLTIPSGARALVVARVLAVGSFDANSVGSCRLATSLVGPIPNTTVTFVLVDTDSAENHTLVGVTPALPAGALSFGIECNERNAPVVYEEIAASAVVIASN
jgi:hypothetical protein